MALLDFVQSILPYAQGVSARTGLPLDFVIAQSAEETGYGTSNAAQNLNNYFGLSPGGSLASYPSIGQGFNAYADLINSHYSNAASGSNPLAIAQNLVAGGYNTEDPGYAQKIASIVPSVDQVLSALGLSGASSTSGATTAGSGTAPIGGASTGSGISATITGAISRVGIILLAIVVVGVGLWMLTKK